MVSVRTMSLKQRCLAVTARAGSRFAAAAKNFLRSRRGNVAMITGLALIPISIAAGTGLDLSRALIVRARLAEALDSAGLAVGAMQAQGMTQQQIAALAQKYFDTNYTADPSFGVPDPVTVTPGTDNVTISTSVEMPTTLMNIVGIGQLKVGYTSQIVWGQTKLWVSLVLDNTGSMCEPDNCRGTDNKITALKSATHALLQTLQNASANPGDVKVALIPFSKDVNVGTSYAGASWIDWTDWEAPPSGSTPSSSVGPGSSCPYSSFSNGYRCTTGPANGSSTTSTIPSTGTYKGYICPGQDNGSADPGRAGHYYNGCYDSVATQTATTTLQQHTNVVTTYSCTSESDGDGNCTGSTSTSTSTRTYTDSNTTVTTSGYSGDSGPTTTTGSPTTTNQPRSTSCSTHYYGTVCTTTWSTTVSTPSTTVTAVAAAPFNHTWIVNDHSTWAGCIMDRTQDYDTENTLPNGSSTDFPAENSAYCPPGTVTPLGYDWSTLSSQVDAMTANGNTNQTVGLAWGWQALTDGDPFNPGTLPSDTTQIIILLSDGLNTQNRWSKTQSAIDTREGDACQNAKDAGVVIYTVFVDLNGAQGSSAALLNCASDSSKYFDLTTTGAIITTFNDIAQQITQLRLAR
jgi:Flp pilus assembly protein TadG